VESLLRGRRSRHWWTASGLVVLDQDCHYLAGRGEQPSRAVSTAGLHSPIHRGPLQVRGGSDESRCRSQVSGAPQGTHVIAAPTPPIQSAQHGRRAFPQVGACLSLPFYMDQHSYKYSRQVDGRTPEAGRREGGAGL